MPEGPGQAPRADPGTARADLAATGARPVAVRGVHRLGVPEREQWARALALRLDRPMSVLGLIFLLVVLGDQLAVAPPLRSALSVVGWLLWGVFVAEFALRLYVAPRRAAFLARNWW